MIRVDWSMRSEYILSRHGIEPAWATQAVEDTRAAWLRPDPASLSGKSVRVIGYSADAGYVLTVILVSADVDLDQVPDGDWWGANAWRAGPGERRIYEKEER